MLHSNGDLSNNHYDMNMVFMDMLLRHLMWTGDLEFAKEVWPALQRHLAWEHRLFRRMYTSATSKELPLYEAYAAIWILMMGFVLLGWRKQGALGVRIDELENMWRTMVRVV